MKKVGTLSPTEQQLCYVHGIHLAVTNVLYKNSNSKDGEDISENEEDASEESETEDDDFDGFTFTRQDSRNCDIIHKEVFLLVKKIRKTVCIFKRSPVKMTIICKSM